MELAKYEEMKKWWSLVESGLKAPFPSDRVKWRVGRLSKDKKKAQVLAYIDARDLMDRFDEVVGLGGWRTFLDHRGNHCLCTIEIYCPFREAWIGATDGAENTKIEAIKGGISDSKKRAAAELGIGRYLYDLRTPWVQVNQWSQIEDHELSRLRAYLDAVESELLAAKNVAPVDEEPEPEPAPEKEPEAQEPEAPAKTPSNPITEEQCKDLLKTARIIGEEVNTHGFNVLQWALKNAGMPTLKGKGHKYPAYMEHLYATLGQGDLAAFIQVLHTYKQENDL
jgi:hypothetical protein